MTAVGPALLVPAALLAVALVAARRTARGARPADAARMLAALSVAIAFLTVWTLATVAATGLLRVHAVAARIAWCRELVVDHVDSVGPLTVAALVLLAAGAVATGRTARRHTAARAPADAAPLAVVPVDEPLAFSLPGRPGQVVVSAGMLRSLDAAERRVLLAHEQAHLRYGHHRYVRAVELAAAVMPLLRPLRAGVRFATERWADEVAARTVGDRRLAARALARAALASAPVPAAGLGAAQTAVAARVEALLGHEPRPGPLLRAAPAAVAGAAAVAAGTAVAGNHHLVAGVLRLCGT